MSTLRVYNVDSGDTNNLVLLGNGSVAATISGTTQAVNFAKSPSINGSTSGAITLAAPAVAGTNTITFPAGTGTAAVQGVSTNIVSGTAVNSTSGTNIDFTGIPSWVKRITVMFNGVSTNGTSIVQVQLGSGTFTTSGYLGSATVGTTAVTSSSGTTGFLVGSWSTATNLRHGAIVISNISGNSWVSFGTIAASDIAGTSMTGGSVSIGGTLDRVRITTVNGTDTFDAGVINILYE